MHRIETVLIRVIAIALRLAPQVHSKSALNHCDQTMTIHFKADVLIYGALMDQIGLLVNHISILPYGNGSAMALDSWVNHLNLFSYGNCYGSITSTFTSVGNAEGGSERDGLVD